MITQKRLKEVLFYDYKTGIFTWLVDAGRGKAFKGDNAGSLVDGYIAIGVDGKNHLAHRLAFLYMEGYFPEHDIDHKDRIRHHNWWSNLREINHQCNIRNTGNYKHNKSGCKGLSWSKERKAWIVDIKANGKNIRLCRTKDFTEAVAHRLAAEQFLDWSNCDSSSPAFKIITKYINKRKQRSQGSY